MNANDTISLADLRIDYANAEAEAAKLEEQAKQARERSGRLAVMIQGLEEWAEEREKRAAPKSPPRIAQPPIIRNMTAGELAAEIIEDEGRPLTTRELATRMVAAGYKSGSQKPIIDAIYGVLSSALKVKGTRLAKIDSRWGLKEWAQKGGKP